MDRLAMSDNPMAPLADPLDETDPKPKLGGLVQPVPEVIDRLGQLLAKRKLVPFFGAGISRDYLGLGSAELAREMAAKVAAPPTAPLADIADLYEDRYGRQGLAEYLGARLHVSAYNDDKASIHRQLLSLAPDVVYTTNQDNIFELASQTYGRSYRAVITPADLRAAGFDEPQLIKLHGDPNVPESLVFSSRSYKQRMDTVDHPFDVKLKSDLHKRELLFLGYSLRDENVGKILASVKQALGSSLPPGYLLAYEYDASMEELKKVYGLEIIDPMKLVVPGLDTAIAFECVMKGICDATLANQANNSVESLLADDTLNTVILTDYELGGLEAFIPSAPILTAIDVFRRHLDETRIPDGLKPRVAAIFESLRKRVDPANDEQMQELAYALAHLRLTGELLMLAVAGYMTLFNRRPMKPGYDRLSTLTLFQFPSEWMPIAATCAVQQLQEEGQQITESFRQSAHSWFDGYRGLESNIRDAVEEAIRIGWPGPEARRSPSAIQSPFHVPSAGEIANQIMASFPKRRPK